MTICKWNFNPDYSSPHLCDTKPQYFHSSGRCCNETRTCTNDRSKVNCVECLEVLKTIPESDITDIIENFVDRTVKL